MSKLDEEAQAHGVENKRRAGEDRRTKERRKPKHGVNIRHDDREGYKPKRIHRGQK